MAGKRSMGQARRIAIAITGILVSVASSAWAQDFEAFEVGLGSGRVSCREGGTVGTTSDEFEMAAEDATAACMRPFGPTEAIVSTTFLPAIADAVVVSSRGESPLAIQATARSTLDFVVAVLPVSDSPPPVFLDVPLTARFRYSLAGLLQGEVRGGCSALVQIFQDLPAGRVSDSAFVELTRFDGVPQQGILEVGIDVDRGGALAFVEAELTCGGTSDPLDGPIVLEAQAQLGQTLLETGLPLEPIPVVELDQEKVDEELGSDSFELKDFFEIVFVPEPDAGSAGAASLAVLAFLRRRALALAEPGARAAAAAPKGAPEAAGRPVERGRGAAGRDRRVRSARCYSAALRSRGGGATRRTSHSGASASTPLSARICHGKVKVFRRASMAPAIWRTASSSSTRKSIPVAPSVSGVRTNPGQIVMAWTPVPWRSMRRPSMNDVTARFDDE
jgi:hypothetical protein